MRCEGGEFSEQRIKKYSGANFVIADVNSCYRYSSSVAQASMFICLPAS